MTGIGKQLSMDMDPGHNYPVEEMGILMGPHQIFLFESFLGKVLGAGHFSYLPEEKTLTKVGCPFCKEGFLKIVDVKSTYSGGPGRAPAIMHHTGNEYNFQCSNPSCDGKFFGTYTWMYID